MIDQTETLIRRQRMKLRITDIEGTLEEIKAFQAANQIDRETVTGRLTRVRSTELANRRNFQPNVRPRIKPKSSRMPYSDEEAVHIIDGVSRLGCTKFAYKTIVKRLTQLGLGVNPAGTGRTPDAIKFYAETFVLHKLPSEGYHGLENYHFAVDVRHKAMECGIAVTPDFDQNAQKILMHQRQPKTQRRRQ
jgi:hypothetical protein